MHGVLPAARQRAIFPADSSDSESSPAPGSVGAPEISDSSVTESSGWFARLARNLWRAKPGAAIHFLTHGRHHERQCHRYAGGHQEPPGRLIVDILRSADGGRFLDEVMRGSDAAWWREHQFALAALPAVEQLRQLALPLK